MHQSYLTEDRHQNEKQKKGKVLTNLKRQKFDRTFRIILHMMWPYILLDTALGRRGIKRSDLLNDQIFPGILLLKSRNLNGKVDSFTI